MTAAATDFSQYSALRAAATDNPHDPEVLRNVASQFESLFIETLLKNMREAHFGDPLLGSSQQHSMYQELLDQQLSVEMSKEKGIGLADVLVRQLAAGDVSSGETPTALPLPPPRSSRRLPGPAATAATPATAVAPGGTDRRVEGSKSVASWDGPDAFVRDIWPHAERAARRLGVDTQAIVAQAALESGWGQHVMQRENGSSSFNLFGIKAGGDWDGRSVTRPTLEFREGVASREHAKFRAYDSLAQAFDDYADFLGGRARYADALDTGNDGTAFARGLQAGGYATDPDYAFKIDRIMSGETLQKAMTALKDSPRLPITTSAVMSAVP